MDCRDVASHLLDYQRGRLSGELREAIRAHLELCPACEHASRAEEALTEVLEARLPQYPASLALKRHLAAAWRAPVRRSRGGRVWWRDWPRVPAAAAALAVLALVVAIPLYRGGTSPIDRERLVGEAVNDHLRMLEGRPLGVEGGGLHQVRPWFAGRLDFAPVVLFEGDEGFSLRGGAIEYFLDRKAAVFVYGRRLHTISLFVVRSVGLPWPEAGRARAYRATTRGFNVILWRSGELGYALVSDVDASELESLAAKLTP